jgi:hypothetical protein
MSRDAEEVLCDESTNLANKMYLVEFVRFVNDGEIQGNFFCCRELPETKKGRDMLNVLS